MGLCRLEARTPRLRHLPDCIGAKTSLHAVSRMSSPTTFEHTRRYARVFIRTPKNPMTTIGQLDIARTSTPAVTRIWTDIGLIPMKKNALVSLTGGKAANDDLWTHIYLICWILIRGSLWLLKMEYIYIGAP